MAGSSKNVGDKRAIDQSGRLFPTRIVTVKRCSPHLISLAGALLEERSWDDATVRAIGRSSGGRGFCSSVGLAVIKSS